MQTFEHFFRMLLLFLPFLFFFSDTSLGVLRFVAPAFYEMLSFSAVLNLTEKRRNIVCNPINLFMYLFTITFKFVFGVGVGEAEESMSGGGGEPVSSPHWHSYSCTIFSHLSPKLSFV